jgi:phosphate-selective porin OprO/OprP
MKNLKASALIGASWIAFAGAAIAQTPPDTREARIRELEARVAQIESELQQLRQDEAAHATAAPPATPAPALTPPPPQPTVTVANGRPTITSADGDFRFQLRALAQFDAAGYMQDSPATPDNRRADTSNASDLNSGGNFRRARIGVEGTAFHDWNYAITYDLGGTGVETPQLNQAYIEYAGWKPWRSAAPLRLRIGAWATPAGLEDATSNAEAVFLERAAAAELVRGIASADGRSGVGVFANGDAWYWSAALTGGVVGNSGEFDEQSGYLARIAFTPLHGQDYAVHLGANITGVIDPADTDPSTGSQQRIRLRERPELRTDTTRFVDTGSIDADGLVAYGGEVGATWRNLYAAGEIYRIDLDRSTAGVDPSFGGWYLQAAWTLTGESRRWLGANGGFQGIRPAAPFDPSAAHWGAWEIAARYSTLDLNFHEGALGSAAIAGDTVRGGEQTVITAGLNWYPNATIRFLLDYQWVDIDRLDPENGIVGNTTIFGGAPSVAGNGAQIGQDYQAISLRSQVSF